jgi:hypothetical protein
MSKVRSNTSACRKKLNDGQPETAEEMRTEGREDLKGAECASVFGVTRPDEVWTFPILGPEWPREHSRVNPGLDGVKIRQVWEV